jgi:hypothetical protein
MKGWIVNLLTMIGSMISVALILEIPLRIVGDPSGGNKWTLAQTKEARESSIWQRSEDPELIYETRANYISGGKRITETHGILRPLDVSQSKNLQEPTGSWCSEIPSPLGSASAGEDKSLTPDRLEEILLRDSSPGVYEVINFGTDGYTTLQEAQILETKAYKFAPDLIVL